MKILQTLSILWQIKVAWKHYRDLFNWRWKSMILKVETTKMNQQHAIGFFREAHPLVLNFCKAKSSLDGCDSMLHDDWLDIPGIVILHYFCFKPRMVSDKKNTQRNNCTIMFLCLFHKGITVKGENSYYLPKVLVLG